MVQCVCWTANCTWCKLAISQTCTMSRTMFSGQCALGMVYLVGLSVLRMFTVSLGFKEGRRLFAACPLPVIALSIIMHACMHNECTSRFRACPFTQAGKATMAALERVYHHWQATAFAPRVPAQSAPPQTCKNGQGPTARVELPATLCRECTHPRAALNTCSAGNGQG